MNEITSQYRIRSEPYYRTVGKEVTQYSAAYAARLPMMLKARPAAARAASSSTWPGSWDGR